MQRQQGAAVLHCLWEVGGRFDTEDAWGSTMQVKHTSKDRSSLDRLGPQHYRNSSAQTPCLLHEQNDRLKAAEY
jgi:hypothetical protein